ncbi:hypothetical protein CCW43_24265 [Salmonella enterica]|uniref:Mor transcription activator domain-containing protein n=2 Tax=Salmonella enterica TaxID=28901 RepID=A0A5V6NK99_SALET|nr:hypothetical protein [Salmonella enterica]EBS4763297.1 hypothetical protein [Salmonella enterica subsp. enterica serovar Poona]ECD2008926.1 hypothetical protein [Salmonella enterica subsp. enterica serovar Give]ECH7874592.1 hypothetical protein [Salmonella enterica subsp. enterica serovar Rubislaw]ECI0430429.1 hypothetical protein [Salmonella enterica subsp. enterica serovar Soumbedioune]ECY3796221.1 hypothetical protein [Salmonella enterica subsp. enterica serovar Minnesota]EDH5423878.1 h
MKDIILDGNALRQMAAYLPESVAQMAEVIGWDTTSRLIERFGGASFPVPRGQRHDGEKRLMLLLEVMTPEQMRRFISTFGGDSSLIIPQCDSAKREWRNRLFIRDLRQSIAAGESRRMALSYLCPRYGIGNTLAWRIIREYGLSAGDNNESLC